MALIPIASRAVPSEQQIQEARQAANVNWWRCQHCGRGEILIGQPDTELEARNATTHERSCTERRGTATDT